MPARRIVAIAVVVLMLGLLVTRLGVGGGTGGLLSLDDTGPQKPAGSVAGSRSEGTGQQQGEQGQTAQATPTVDAGSIEALDQASVQKDAFILLNPASATASSNVGVTGSGFDPASVIDLYLTADPKNDQQPQELGFAQADSSGSFGNFSFGLPPNYRAPTFTVIARERNSSKEAMATGRLEALRPSVKLGTNVGAVGDLVQISAQGFMPNEEVKVYFNSLGTDPFQSFKTSNSGTLERVAIRIPYGPVGNNSLIFVGSESQSPVTVQFLMLTLYPNVALSSYATKADTVLAFSGSGFGPDEGVAVHLNNPQAPPIVKFKTSDDGTFENSGAFVIPFELSGKNTLIFVGEKSQATATAGFDVLPHTPNVQPSTYGGRPGTTITFYGDGFARAEVARFYVDRTRDSLGRQVSCAKADDQGRIGAGGSYTIPGDAQPGQLTFTVVGSRSRAVTTTAIEVMDAGFPIQTPAEPKTEFQCPFDDEEAGQQQLTPPPASPAQVPPTPQRTQPQAARPQAAVPAKPTAVPTATPRATAAPTATPPARVTMVPTPSGGTSAATGREQAPATGRAAVVTGEGGAVVQMRGDPANSNSIKARLDSGSTVELQGDTRTVGNEQWIRIKAGGQEGWVPVRAVQAAVQERAPQPAGR